MSNPFPATKNDTSKVSATTLPGNNKSNKKTSNISGLQTVKRPALRPSSCTLTNNQPSPRRKRTERNAKAILNDAPLTDQRRRAAYRHIKNAKQPIKTATKIAERALIDVDGQEIPVGSDLDLSDVQELRVKLLRRDFGIWPPHTDYLNRMEVDILSGAMTKQEFKRRSSVLLRMEQPLSKASRLAEQELSRS